MDQMEQNEDLREARLRYFETYAFPLFSHIDLRVSDADAVRPFYDALMALFDTDQRRHESCGTAILGATAPYGQTSSIFLTIPTRVRHYAYCLRRTKHCVC